MIGGDLKERDHGRGTHQRLVVQGKKPGNPADATDLFAPDAVFHYLNPRLPDIQGDYIGIHGIRSFFEKIGAVSAGTFQVEPILIAAMGDELVVMHNKNRLTLQTSTAHCNANAPAEGSADTGGNEAV